MCRSKGEGGIGLELATALGECRRLSERSMPEEFVDEVNEPFHGFSDGKYAVIDDLVPESFAEFTEQRLLNNVSLGWHAALQRDDFSTVARSKWGRFGTIESFLEGPQLCHSVVFRGEVIDAGELAMVQPIRRAISAFLGGIGLQIERCKYNLQFQLPGNAPGRFNCPHRDCSKHELVAVYYVNDSDGMTYLFRDEGLEKLARIESKRGRVVLFRGDTLHAGQHPINSPVRSVMNFNFSVR